MHVRVQVKVEIRLEARNQFQVVMGFVLCVALYRAPDVSMPFGRAQGYCHLADALNKACVPMLHLFNWYLAVPAVTIRRLTPPDTPGPQVNAIRYLWTHKCTVCQ